MLRPIDRVASVEAARHADGTTTLTARPERSASIADAVGATLRGAGVHVLAMSIDSGKLDEVFRLVTRPNGQRAD